VVFREQERCRFCYYLRLKAAARVARGGKFDAFTSTLLYSKFQNHEMIRELAQQVGQEVGTPFYYVDFRQGWSAGMAKSKKMGLYRQQYCGCVFSERDRYRHPSRGRRGDALVKG
jgi:predicted adenine nucleotide alpha hydrolase (AANH) superfamily ATPase